jgi:hypothetical protein
MHDNMMYARIYYYDGKEYPIAPQELKAIDFPCKEL